MAIVIGFPTKTICFVLVHTYSLFQLFESEQTMPHFAIPCNGNQASWLLLELLIYGSIGLGQRRNYIKCCPALVGIYVQEVLEHTPEKNTWIL